MYTTLYTWNTNNTACFSWLSPNTISNFRLELCKEYFRCILRLWLFFFFFPYLYILVNTAYKSLLEFWKIHTSSLIILSFLNTETFIFGSTVLAPTNAQLMLLFFLMISEIFIALSEFIFLKDWLYFIYFKNNFKKSIMTAVSWTKEV